MDRVDYQSLIVQDLINDHRDGKLNLNPWYQRRSVWTPSQKSYLINTLFERKPIPAVYIRHSIDLENQRSTKEIVDGQQRSRSIIEYCSNQFAARTVLKQRKFFRDLSPVEREKFLLTPIPAGYLLGATDSDVIDIFARINSISKTLNSQEKRNAKFSGEFKQLCLKLSTENVNFWRATGVFSANSISRMEEVLFVSDLVLNLMNGLSDFRPSDLDKLYEKFEEDFPREVEISERFERVLGFLDAVKTEAIKDTIFSRPPILFSLFLCLDTKTGVIGGTLEEKLFTIDSEVRDEANSGAEVVKFRDAIASSTQRLSSRRVRSDFLAARL